ncbi:MAG: dehypoxanthine futalosine cyclase [Bacteroidetes bacterium GWC2_33_15]|nr:MAG: dehypoxanthine futalosine cyclase [Bacteroidetes bacterium GWA2_33_15]OFX51972.1 MAG: dehypoxanthine futalosine cyclase [Bacteroidetes bacterium GWC2_33_15]OFX63802.1 MAG: dehypoxanthine futalosine cyclase [Bacteroidetes bacterium GWB2_32_14]OFX67375.1 MAG: dehypoxanthine futalosine cyclase [Bacteroidetes bacterium GWD2_33_33]HAN17863.1 dehypoxanthine futalosine cyclase [Bacteroidales bacterium]
MKIKTLINKALALEFLSAEEGLFLYENAPLEELIYTGNALRQIHNPGNIVTWQIDRNVNITNACISQCKFCNFYKNPKDYEVYITGIEEYKQKIDELFKLGGNQLLLQGGLHPKLGLSFYTDLFKELKSYYPNLKLHALGPPEIVHIARLEKKSHREILESLIFAGLDSLPGAGAEILCDRVRKSISPAKANTKQWLDVMREAHKLNLVTSATMMFGHIETRKERLEHLVVIREVQSEKPSGSHGFLAFIPWPFQDKNTELQLKSGILNSVSSREYIRTIAMSRIMLPNIKNIQASWLTVGKDIAQVCLHSGANDFGSIMIEENVVSAAGADFRFDAEGIQFAIREAGFVPQFRNQKYEFIEYNPS